jgi:hypothetical protein
MVGTAGKVAIGGGIIGGVIGLFAWLASGGGGKTYTLTVNIPKCKDIKMINGVQCAVYISLYQGQTEKYSGSINPTTCSGQITGIKAGTYVCSVYTINNRGPTIGSTLCRNPELAMDTDRVIQVDDINPVAAVPGQIAVYSACSDMTPAGPSATPGGYVNFDITSLRNLPVKSISIRIVKPDGSIAATSVAAYSTLWSAAVALQVSLGMTPRAYKLYATVEYTSGAIDTVGWNLTIPTDVGKTLHYMTAYKSGRIQLPMTAGDIGVGPST